MRSVLLAAVLLGVTATARAQSLEVGGTIAAGCVGSDGSACGNGTNPAVGVHVSWWIADRFELTGRLARVPLDSFGTNTTFPSPVSISVTDRSRGFISGMFTYHFRRGKSVRPLFGFGSGGVSRAYTARCEPACAGVPGLPPEGRQRTWITDVILLIGLSGHVGDRWVVRGGCLSHRFANDENSVIEYFAGLGYRFGTP